MSEDKDRCPSCRRPLGGRKAGEEVQIEVSGLAKVVAIFMLGAWCVVGGLHMFGELVIWLVARGR